MSEPTEEEMARMVLDIASRLDASVIVVALTGPREASRAARFVQTVDRG
jgi:uncharacterized UPF0146 family protein